MFSSVPSNWSDYDTLDSKYVTAIQNHDLDSYESSGTSERLCSHLSYQHCYSWQ